MELITADSLTVSLSDREILHGITFTVQSGRWLGVLGPNGCGKTTLLRTLAGLLPFDGSLRLDDRPLMDWPLRDRARRIAMVAQSLPMAFDFSVAELTMLGRAPHKHWLSAFDRNDHEHMDAALAAVDLIGFESRSILALSGGEQRRVLLAQALVQEAELLLLDEPTSHLDVHHGYEFLDHVRALVDGGSTAIGVFHDLELAARYSDEVIVMDNGVIAASGPPEQVLTSELIAEVFLMDAESGVGPDGVFSIDFHAPIPRNVRNGHGHQA